MYQMYTTAELAAELSCTEKTARKRAKKEGFETILKEVNGRQIEAFNVPNDKINELKNKVQFAKQKYSGMGEYPQEDIEDVSEPSQEYTEYTSVKDNGQNFVFHMMDKYREDIKDITDTFRKDMVEKDKEIIAKERQVLLLEDSERRKENDYIRQIAELKSEKERNKLEIEALKKQIVELQKPWWHLKK